MRPWLTLLVVLGFGAVGYAAWHGLLDKPPTDETRNIGEMVRLPFEVARSMPVKPVHTIYLNREGARLHAATRDDARKNLSTVVHASQVDHVEIPAFAGPPARWDTIVRCVQSKFEPFDVRVVDQRPVEGEYIMAVFGGHADALAAAHVHDHEGKSHQHAKPTGLAPYSGRPIPNAVVMVFTRALREEVRPTCEVAAMEIAHAYGLDHARHCGDIMTYMRPCGAKHFLDKDLPCGEYEDRTCGDGAPTQNSKARLLALLGPRPSS